MQLNNLTSSSVFVIIVALSSTRIHNVLLQQWQTWMSLPPWV